MKPIVLVMLTLLSVAVDVHAQAYEKLLIPIYIAYPLEGAYGSRWVSRLTIANRSNEPVTVWGVEACPTGPCAPPSPIPPQTTMFPTFNAVPYGAMWGMVFVDATQRKDVSFSLRLHDTSRQLSTWGTAIPVIYEDELFAGLMTILDVPNDSIGRVTIRVYDTDPMPGDGAVFRVYATSRENITTEQPTQPDTLIAEMHAVFGTIPARVPPGVIVSPLEAIVSTSATRLRIDIIPDDQARKYWAFGSVTNNDTQHVTLLLPK